MCSIAEADFGDDGGEHTMLKDLVLNGVEDENCKKCSVEKCVIKLDFKEAMCKSCVLNYIQHKFRATIGASKILKRQSNVLLEFKGTKSDVCLLSMIKLAFEEEAYKRLTFNLKLVFIDENCMTSTGDVLENRLEIVHEIRDIMQQFNSFTCCYSTIADSSKIINNISTITCNEMEGIIKSEKEVLTAYQSIESLTSKQDFIEILRKNAIRDIAHQLNCPYIFVSDISVDLAKKLISNIALGRGASVSNDVSFCDDRIDSIKIIRPLKDLNQVEVESYIKFNNLKFSSLDTFVKNDNLSSIQNLTSNFIDGLQKNGYNSTISTVYKCSSKIAPNKKTQSNQNDTISSKLVRSYITDINQRCHFCKSLLDYHDSETLHAIEFSRCVSSQTASNLEGIENLQKIRDMVANAEVGNGQNKNLCHGCRNIVSEMNEEGLTKIF